jgi:hypothetical protein
MEQEFSFEGKVWEYEGKGAWHFVTLPRAVAVAIERDRVGVRKAFGTLKVLAIVGGTRWKTSIFKDNARRSYLLAIKAEVRRREQIQAGMTVEVTVLLEGEISLRR